MKKLAITLAVVSLINASLALSPGDTALSPSYAKTYKGNVYRYSYTGQNLIDQGKLDQAEGYYKKILKRNPNHQNARVGLGNVYSTQYKLDAAEKEYKQVLRANPKHPGAHNGLGLVAYRRTTSSNQSIRNKIPQLYEQAISEFKTALRYAPNFPEAHSNLGRIYQEQGKIDLAEQQYRKALDVDPQYSTAMVRLGSVYYTKGEYEAAIDNYKQAIKVNSGNSTAHYRLGEAYAALGRYDDAIKALNTSIAQNPNSAPAMDKLGEVYEMQGNTAAAINQYRKAILTKPEYNPAYLKLANVFEQRGDEELAISELRSAVAVNPSFTEGKVKIADISTSVGKEVQAIKMYQDVLNQDPNNQDALKGLAKAYFYQAKKDSLGGYVSSPGEFVLAEQSLRRAVALQPNDLELRLALMRMNELAGNRPAAEQELNIIASRIPQTPADSIIKGQALFDLKRYEDAQREFSRALTYSNNPKDVLLMGDIFTQSGNLTMAKEAYTKALALDPNNPKSAKALVRIERLADDARTDYRAGYSFFKEGQRYAAIDNWRKSMGTNSVEPMVRWMLAEAYYKEDFYQDALDEYRAFLALSPRTEKEEKLQRKAAKNVRKLEEKIRDMKYDGDQIKIYDEYVRINRNKY